MTVRMSLVVRHAYAKRTDSHLEPHGLTNHAQEGQTTALQV